SCSRVMPSLTSWSARPRPDDPAEAPPRAFFAARATGAAALVTRGEAASLAEADRGYELGDLHDRIDLDARAARQRRNLVRGPCGIRLLEIGVHYLVGLVEITEIGEQQRDLDDVVELAPGRLRHRAQVLQHLVRLVLDAIDQVASRGIEADLARHVDGVADADRLRVRADRRRRVLGMDLLLAHDASCCRR